MLEKFFEKFDVTSRPDDADDVDFYKNLPKDLFNLLTKAGGSSFKNGVYRIHSFRSSMQWSLRIADFFENYKNNIYPFGFDWMGRQFCLSINFPNILFMFDPSTGEDFELKQELLLLHENDFVNDTDDMLSINLFNTILSSNNLNSIKFNECLGYKIPLFLGGKDTIENYERQDLEVYWHIQNQLYTKMKDIPGGARVQDVRLE